MTSEIEVEINAGDSQGNYVAHVLRAASGGEPTSSMALDLDGLLGGREALERSVLLSTVSARKAIPVEERALREVGTALFDSLFRGSLNGVYRASLMVAQERGEHLRIVLRLNAPGLAALPWEALWDTEMSTYTCMREPLVRHVPAPYTLSPLDVPAPLRILVLTASPRGLPDLDVEAEQEHLSIALAQPVLDGLIQLEWLHQASWQAVHAKLLSGRWHVLHFIGHGDYDVDNDQGLIALVGADGRKELVEAERLAALLGEAEPTPRLVVLNSCSSGEEGTGDLFSGTAAALVRSGINAVAAMQFTVSDEAALRFSRGFYTALARGRDVAAAIRAGRIEILGSPGTLEWVTPVLYLRGENMRLFDLHQQAQLSSYGGEPPDSRIGNVQPPVPTTSADVCDTGLDQMHEQAQEARGVAYKSLGDSAVRPQYERRLSLADEYQRAISAEEVGDLPLASQMYSQIVEADPGYKDAMLRLEVCDKKNRIGYLQDEIRKHANSEDWVSVLAANEKLLSIDRHSADPEGLATRAQRLIEAQQKEVRAEEWYWQARNAEGREDWKIAVRLYEKALRADVSHPDASERAQHCRAAMRNTRLLESRYEEATKAERMEDWETAAYAYQDVLEIHPGYRDAAERWRAVRRQIANREH